MGAGRPVRKCHVPAFKPICVTASVEKSANWTSKWAARPPATPRGPCRSRPTRKSHIQHLRPVALDQPLAGFEGRAVNAHVEPEKERPADCFPTGSRAPGRPPRGSTRGVRYGFTTMAGASAKQAAMRLFEGSGTSGRHRSVDRAARTSSSTARSISATWASDRPPSSNSFLPAAGTGSPCRQSCICKAMPPTTRASTCRPSRCKTGGPPPRPGRPQEAVGTGRPVRGPRSRDGTGGR